MSSFFFKTANTHNYLYEQTNKFLIYLPPQLAEALKEGTNGENNYYDRKAIFLKGEIMRQNDSSISSDNTTKAQNNAEELFINYNESNVWSNIVSLDHILLEVTQKCNLNCKYCIYGKYYEYDKTRKNKNLDINTAKTLLDYILNIKLKNNSFNKITVSFYGGEPLLNTKLIEEVVRYLKANYETIGFKFAYSMTTNGILLLKKQNFLIENDFKISVSLDGNKTNNQFRTFKNGDNSFNVVYNNLKFISKNFPDYFRDNVNILTVFHKLNSLEKILLYFKQEFGKTPSISSIQIAGVNEALKQDFFNMFFIQEIENQQDSINTMLELKTTHPVFKRIKDIISKEFGFFANNFDSLLYRQQITSNLQLPSGTCSPFELRLFLTVEGWILPCEHIDFRFRLGECIENSVKLNLKSIEKFYNDLHSQHKSKCYQCFLKSSCSVCMFNMEYDSFGNPICSEFKSESSFIKHLSDVISDMETYPEITEAIFKE
ncbi:MAG: radical SAM peptide maturase [Bacteroidales bacterium]|jgi:uncharacterized protein|nr:radical SAM peptide maturase [Bacteroidales bacterium]